MKCGAPATLRRSKQFSWYPPWIAIILLVAWPVFLILALVLTKKRRLSVPLCDRHRLHWVWPPVIILSSLLVPLGIGFCALLLDARDPDIEDLRGFVCAAALVGLVVWIILVIIIQARVIRPTEITGTGEIALAGVSPVFIEAYHEEREEEHRQSRLDRSVREHFGQRRATPGRVEEDERYRQADEEEEPRRPDGYRSEE
jgi:hypothetical protein